MSNFFRQPANALGWTPGARSMGAPNLLGMGFRENMARGRKRDMDDTLGNDTRRPKFDLMGKMREWGEEKGMGRGKMGKYFYVDYLVDMEGYPEEVRNYGNINRTENLNLTLLSLAEERKFWKSFYYYTQAYEAENEENMVPLDYLKSQILDHVLRMSNLASPAISSTLRDHGIDDATLTGISLNADYTTCSFPDDLLNILDGHFLYHVLTENHSVTPEQVQTLLLEIQKLKSIPVELLNTYGEVVEEKLCTFDEIPDLHAVTEAFGLEGGPDKWYIDIRNFYSTPGRMIFDDYNYHSFLLDWFYTGSYKFEVAAGKKIQVAPRPLPEQDEETRRGWFHVI